MNKMVSNHLNNVFNQIQSRIQQRKNCQCG